MNRFLLEKIFGLLKGIRRIDKALAAAAQQLRQSRPSAAKIVVLITTGRQAQVLGMTPLDRASQPLRDSNANILVIGIGKQPDIRELNLISKNPQNVKIIPSPDEVIINVHLLSRQLRREANKGEKSTFLSFFVSFILSFFFKNSLFLFFSKRTFVFYDFVYGNLAYL